MSFSETIIFIFLFVTFYNVINLARQRWVVMSGGKCSPSVKELILLIVLTLSTLGVCVYGCYYAYSGFSAVYSKGISLIATSIFFVCSSVLLKNLYSASSVYVKFKKE